MLSPLLGPYDYPDHYTDEIVERWNMSRHMDFIGQRADKFVVVGFGERRDGIITKKVDHYTVSCDECDGVGYYDDRGEIICDGCGMVLSATAPVVNTEYSGNSDSPAGQSRGVEKLGDRQAQVGHEPSVS